MARIIEKRFSDGMLAGIDFEGEDYEQAVKFLMDCIEYAADEDLVHLSTDEAIDSQVDGYTATFGDELPELLRDPYWMMVCWNRAVTAEQDRRKALRAAREKAVSASPKTYYIIKAYASRYIDGEYVERFHYFGKSNKLMGYITEAGVQRYNKDDIRNHGYRSYRKALEAGWALKGEERTPEWTVVITIIAELA